MNCLLDTSSLIWTLMQQKNLSPSARELISNDSVVKHVSAVSLLEMSIKISIGKLALNGITMEELPGLLYSHNVEMIVLDPFEAASLCLLPYKEDHRDPFDRMLICQAISRNLTLISSDEKMAQYREHGLSLIW